MMNRERKLSRWVTLVLALLLVGSGSTAQAQWAVQNQVLASSGGTWSVGGWTLDFTLGEPVIETWALGAPGSAGAGSGGWGSVTQGFHQPQRVRVPVVSPVGVPDLPVGVAEVYPNPFSSDIHLRLPASGPWTCILVDAHGRQVAHGGGAWEGERVWDLSGLASGSYVLIFQNAEGHGGRTHLIKTHDR